ncbi:MAG: hypothetical protein Q8K59_12355 [Nitrosomonas sp.]|nr:hypothetical protein [Nitrosomonas sp.]MDP1951857.1 hypothetical protein [Nitrosomonas sp.]
MVTKRGKQASRKAGARKYGFLEVPIKEPLQLPRPKTFVHAQMKGIIIRIMTDSSPSIKRIDDQ